MGSNARSVALDFLSRRAPVRPEVVAEDSLSPDRVFAGLAHLPCPVYLWSDGQTDKGRYSIVAASPHAVLTLQQGLAVLESNGETCTLPGSALQQVESLLAAGAPTGVANPSGLPFVGGAIGYISYEWACNTIGVHKPRGPLPDLCFALYDSAYVYDHQAPRGYWVGSQLPLAGNSWPQARPRLTDWTSSVTRETYLAHVEHVLEQIAVGRLYQANYTQRWTAEGHVDNVSLALAFRQKLPSSMGAYLGFPAGQVWSLSPERLLSGRRGEVLESRPIKGTRPRGLRPDQDFALGEDLTHHPKDRAELLMIVDLVRNDLGKVASTGTVSVPQLFALSSSDHVHHLEAVVRSDFPQPRTWTEALTAVLPGGSVTGAPKKSAVELLAQLEPVPRSVYTGALGYLSYNGRGDFNLPIRTLYRAGDRFFLHSGGGVVADSDPAAEYEESLVKVSHIRALLASL